MNFSVLPSLLKTGRQDLHDRGEIDVVTTPGCDPAGRVLAFSFEQSLERTLGVVLWQIERHGASIAEDEFDLRFLYSHAPEPIRSLRGFSPVEFEASTLFGFLADR